ncbi:MAG: hypothetical protein JXQ90_08075 [Cyclobacteriaceae bacterium]
MLKRIFFIIAIAALLGAGYFAYDNWSKNRNKNLWSFVPQNAALVYESNEMANTIAFLNEQPIYKSLREIKAINQLHGHLDKLDSILNEEGGLDNFLNNTSLITSAHISGNQSFDFLHLAEISTIQQHTVLTRLQQGFEQLGFTKRTRKYLEFVITEMRNAEGVSYTYIFHRNYFIGSFTAYLVEDAIRTYSDESMLSFKKTFPELSPLTKLQQDQGDIYLNMDQFGKLLHGFTQLRGPINFAKSGFLDVQVNEGAIELNGFTLSSAENNIQRLGGSSGSSFDISEVVSNNTAVLEHYGFVKAEAWQSNLTSNQKSVLDPIRSNYLSEFDINLNHILTLLDGEVAIAKQFAGNNERTFVFLEMKNGSDATEFINSCLDRYFQVTADSVFRDEYRNLIISSFPFTDFLPALFGDIVPEFQDQYFTTYRNYFVFSNSLPGTKQLIDDILEENTWKKSLRKNKFLEQTSQESGYGIYVNLPNYWPKLMSLLNDEWKPIARSNDFIFKSFENIAIQFNPVDNKYFTNINIHQPEELPLNGKSITTLKSIHLSAPIIRKPQLVKNHNNGQLEIMVQDSVGDIYLIDPEFKVLWSKSIGKPILGKVHQLDYYRNNKLQYVFITENEIHMLDRNGDNLPGYPKGIKGAEQLEHLTLIDYKGDKQYRLAISDIKGNIYLTDKEGTPLDGWNPNKLGNPLVSPPRHYRIGGTDVIAMVLANGEIHLQSRRARSYPGFPIKLDQDITGDFNIDPGSNFASTVFSTISENGDFLQVDFKAKTLARRQFYKPSESASFELLNDVAEKSMIILLKDENLMQILDENEQILFDKSQTINKQFFAQYYQLGGGKDYVITGDRNGRFIYLYDMAGKLITSRPLAGNQPVSMMYFENQNQHHAYLVEGNELMLIRLQ